MERYIEIFPGLEIRREVRTTTAKVPLLQNLLFCGPTGNLAPKYDGTTLVPTPATYLTAVPYFRPLFVSERTGSHFQGRDNFGSLT